MDNTLSRKEAERRRMRAMSLLDDGLTQSQVARMLGVSYAAVSQWAKAKREGGGVAALKAKPHLGPKPKLNAKQFERLQKMLTQGPTRHGYTNEWWTLQRVGQLIQKKFGVRYDPSGVWRLLRRLGWSCQKPERSARERDEDAIVTWRKKDWPRIKKTRVAPVDP